MVKGAEQAVKFYVNAFGASELVRFDTQPGKLMAQLAIAGANIWVGDEEPEYGNISPTTLGGTAVRLVITIDDPDTLFLQALQAGATQICPMTTEEDWRIGKLRDPFGHVWEIGRPLEA